jgi:methylmalonyl-CoA/ethylmalonyl-CoA epimerase
MDTPVPQSPPARAAARALAHVSIATPDAEGTAKQYGELFGATVRSRETLPDRGLFVVFLDCAGVPIELIQPLHPDDEKNTVAKFLKAKGPGLHHVAFFVDDAQASLDHARDRGARLVDQVPRSGADGCKVAFLHPGSTSGVLVEFVEGGHNAPPPRT